jgi:alkanesulfonate monooxygenase SsuD/methylene tetrahydromethanopterin reductase-like flavin-dependent oxidoreductase (luciferase family)
MQFGFVPRRLMGFPSDSHPTKPFNEWFPDLVTVVHTAEQAGFQFMGVSHMQSLILLARYAAIPTKLRFVNETLTLPMLDPVQLAPAAAYVDQMLDGRLDLGVSIGYRPWDLQAAGISRQDRVPKFIESIEIIKRMWTRSDVSFHGKYFNFDHLEPLARPVQKPHPPIVVSSQAHGSAARAGQLADGLCVAPAVYHADAVALAETFRAAYEEAHGKPPTYVNARRDFYVGPDPRTASAQAGAREKYLQFGSEHDYIRGRMQEKTGVKLHLDPVNDVGTDFAFCGTYAQMAEQLAAFQEKAKLTHITCSFYNLPDDMSARMEFLQGFGEHVIPALRDK